MRQNKWNVEEAESWMEKAGGDPADRELALRVYSSRLIGSDPDLVQHGGGNTSVKLTRSNLFGEPIRVLHVKGSGWDLDSLLAPGLPGVRMEPLMALRQLDRLSDEDMVNIQRANLIDSGAPNPSVETLLHAYLPHTYVDHTHASAFLAIANLPNAEEVIAEIFGDRLAVVPFIMPGFDLARKAAEIYDANPDVEGLVLLQHGHFTFGPTARESYDRVISHTNEVEAYLAERAGGRGFATSVHRLRAPIDADIAADVLPVLRGAVARVRGDHHGTGPMPVIMDVRSGPVVEEFLARTDLDELATRGVGSPDHVIRAKGEMLNLDRADVEGGATAIEAKVDAFVARYRDRFEAQNKRLGGVKVMLEPHPCAAWIYGVGVVGIGKDANIASATADILEQNIEVMTFGEAIGEFRPVSSEELFEMEYWSLEQAKLAGAKSKEFAGRVVLVTGGAGAIGFAIARAFAGLGATLAVVDRDGEACRKAAARLGGHALAIEADLTAAGAADEILQKVAARFGGLDILVSNAGAAIAGSILEMEEAAIRSSFELNFFSHLSLARAASRLFAAQGRGGQMLFNVSKQAVNPGKGFGAYGLPKAATFFLVRQLALELGDRGIRVNGVNADRIRSGLLTDDFIESRAKARGISVDTYMAGNLLKAEVEASHVADAFVALARSERTTAHVITVDGGNIEAALR
ncbi:rhamnose utilization protein RhaD (predicted bifunctional aldolase and dehydrogenase) [Hoeflea marina]|uniref:Rhamnose utilization protein RhaD (Predicted bifunctional aldolase and dehydrogenase) n=1 Tax=Hoeflea marina TaxID=274592 RepID=A0A317PLV7_9HYPH|nr:bifunctional aldolase/short-chain dehydrogenase [Hoeflea marina]PWW00027.1 rhamnose utilization protein RhaD (predicted bifunctional aldolase and dehydrogenase) [Hoeflea marina]